jgi:hypothetical protein
LKYSKSMSNAYENIFYKYLTHYKWKVNYFI